MPKILFIDDEKDILNCYLSAIGEQGSTSERQALVSDFFEEKPTDSSVAKPRDLEFTCLTAVQGEEGVELIQQGLDQGDPVQVAFVDMRMPPGIDGKETAKRIRALDPRIELVVVTAYSDTKPNDLMLELGFADKLLFVRKPFDQSEIRQLARNLTEKYRSERIKDEFIGNVTHELKTPLASVLGFTELALQSDINGDVQELLRISYDNAKLMRTLITDLLNTLHIERGGLRLAREEIDVGSYVSDVYRSTLPLFNDGRVAFKVALPEERVSSHFDPGRLRQVLFNLISNAAKFTDEGEVVLAVLPGEDYVRITVSDSGPGIAHEALSKITEKFYRVENSAHQVPGLGLGLYLVKKLLDAHGVSLAIESQPGVGSRFSFDLPTRRAA